MIHAKYIGYLSADAETKRLKLIELGLDEDLAFSVLESLYGESIYELPERDSDDGKAS